MELFPVNWSRIPTSWHKMPACQPLKELLPLLFHFRHLKVQLLYILPYLKQNLSYTIYQMSFHPNTLHHLTSVGCTSRQWSPFSHETEGSDCAAMSPTGGHCEWHWGWGRLKDTLASSPDGLSEACQMAVTATCPSLRTVTMYKQTITLICECTALCVYVCVYQMFVHRGMIALSPLNEHAIIGELHTIISKHCSPFGCLSCNYMNRTAA